MVAADAGAEVTIIEEKGLGGSAVLTDVVPSKTLIATADAMRRVNISTAFGVRFGEHANGLRGGQGEDVQEAEAWADFSKVNERLLKLAHSQSRDIRATLESYGVRVIIGRGKLVLPHSIEVTSGEQAGEVVVADAIIVATGAHPRELGSAKPDGERIFNWTQAYNLTEAPEHMIVVAPGSPEPSSPRRTVGSAPRSRWSPPATRCCPGRTPMRPRCWRTPSHVSESTWPRGPAPSPWSARSTVSRSGSATGRCCAARTA